MTKEEYEKLNDYYNELILGLSVNDRFFIDNFYIFGNISESILNMLDEYEFKHEKKEDKLTFMQIYDLAKQVIYNINPNYLEDFSRLIDSGRLIVNYDRLNIPRSERDPDNSCYRSMDDTISIEHSFNYDAVPALIHEYFHKLNFSDNKARYLLTEYISIYFELYSYEYLKETVDKDDISLEQRLIHLKNNAEFLNNECFYLFTFDKLGNFNDTTYKYINYSKISKDELETELKQELDGFEKLEISYNKLGKFDNYSFRDFLTFVYNQDYKYLLGILLAYYSLYFKTPKDVLRLNEVLIDNSDITLDEALKVIGITLNDETIMNAEYAIKKYISDNELDKSNTQNKRN